MVDSNDSKANYIAEAPRRASGMKLTGVKIKSCITAFFSSFDIAVQNVLHRRTPALRRKAGPQTHHAQGAYCYVFFLIFARWAQFHGEVHLTLLCHCVSLSFIIVFLYYIFILQNTNHCVFKHTCISYLIN